MKRLTIIQILAFIILQPIFGSPKLDFTLYTEKDGLASNTIDCIFQDQEGYLYFATNKGLSVFDGNTFHNYNSRNTTNFSNSITIIKELDSSHLIIGSRYKGIFLYNKKNNIIRNIKCNNISLININDILVTKEKTLWTSNLNGKLYYLSDYKKLFQHSDIEFTEVKHQFPPINKLNEVDNQIYVSNNSNQIITVALNDGHVLIEKRIKIRNIKSTCFVATLNSEELSVATNRGVVILHRNNKEWRLKKEIIIDRGLTVVKLLVHDKNIYAATEKGLYKISTQDYKTQKVNLKECKQIISIFKDKVGNLWLGTWNRGLFKYPIKVGAFKWEEFENKNNSPHLIWNLYPKSTQNYYLTTLGSGICTYNVKNQKIEVLSNKYPSVYTLYTKEGAKNIYVGTWGQGFKIFNKKALRYKAIKNNPLKNERIYSITPIDNQQLLIGTNEKGLWTYNITNEEIRPLTSNKPLPRMKVRTVVKDKDYYWIATYNSGLYYLKINSQNQITECKQFLIPNNVEITSIEKDGDKLWVCLLDGLSYIDLNNQKLIVEKKLSGYMIKDIIKVEKDKYWLASNEGLLLYNRKTGALEQYLSTHTFYDLYFDSPSNMILGCSSSGLLKIDLKDLNSSPIEPKPLIRKLYIDGILTKVSSDKGICNIRKSINYLDTLILPANNTSVSLALSALNYDTTRKYPIFYKLEGLEKRWNRIDTYNSIATYSNIPSGGYNLKIRIDKIENINQEKNLLIIKKEYWWNTLLFRVITISLITALLGWLIRRKYKKDFHKKVKKVEIKKSEEFYQQKIQFFTNISHDLKTPLTLLVTPITDLAESKDMPKQFKSRLLSMQTNGELLLKRINKILNYKTIEQSSTINYQEIPVERTLTDIIFPFKEFAEREGLHFIYNQKNDGLEENRIFTDRNKLESIIENIISNAIKYTKEGGTINVHHMVNSDNLEISISDTGIGIKESNLEQIFERYFRTAPKNSKGTGLGLYLVKKQLEELNGKIKVTSKINEGSTFEITIPISHNTTNQLDEETELSVNEHKKTILIIDDNKEMRQYLVEILQEQYNILESNNGKSGIEAIKEQFPDLVITDLMMPEVSGIELCKEIKSNMNTSHVPIIVLTAKDDNKTRIECVKAGADLLESKPFNSQLLKIKIENLIRNRQIIKYKYQISPSSLSNDNKSPKKESLENKFIEELNKCIDDNLNNPDLSIENIAQLMSMRHDQLYRKIKTLTGVSINQYIRTYRLNIASKMLESKKYMVTEVLYSVGFSNPSYFTKCFKKQFGMLPSEFIESKNENIKE